MRAVRGRAALAAVAAMVVVGGLAGCSQGVEPTRDESGAISESESDADIFSIKAGDCINDSDETEISTIEAVPCAEEHDNEVYAVVELDEGGYPGDDAVDEAADEGCAEEFTKFIGLTSDESDYEYIFITPTSKTWADGDREVLCLAYADDLSKLTGTLKGIAA